jgi:hypothetical protein
MLGIPDRSPCNPDAHRILRGARRRSRPSGRKNAHRGLRTSAKPASRPTHSQVPIVPGKNFRCCTISHRTPLLPQGNQQDQSHKYVITRATSCSADAAFNALKAPGFSAPGAPATQEGFTRRITLTGANPISQSVDSSTRTIVNTTLPGHEFYPGTVTIQVDPAAGGGSMITVTGAGTGPNPELNDVAGELIFGSTADNVAWGCGTPGATTIPNP